MSSYMELLKGKQSEILTENGEKTYNTSLSSLVDLFGMGASYRTRSDKEVKNLFMKAYAEDPLLALKTLFYIRDCRGGQGERRFFREAIKPLAKMYPEVVEKNLDNFAKFGRWDDLFVLLDTDLKNAVLKLIDKQMKEDMDAFKENKPISSLAKWMKSENTSSKESKRIGKILREGLGLSPAVYRKVLSKLRAYSNVVEVKMSAKEWEGIDYEKLPSKAAMIYRNAFQKHDPNGYSIYISAVESGEKKINSATLFPYEIIRDYEHGMWHESIDKTLEAQWNALPDYFEGKEENSLCIVDTSGSMSGLPIQVALSLGIYTAQRNKGKFHNYFMTFSERPTLQELKGKSLLEQMQNMNSAHWDMNTNLQAAFNLLLKTAVEYEVPESEMIKTLYIISDMEFDYCVSGSTAFETIKRKYNVAGYTLPEVVFWNVDARNDNMPVRYNEDGVALVSGCSPSIFKTVVSGRVTSPVDIMMETINQKRYDSVVV